MTDETLAGGDSAHHETALVGGDVNVGANVVVRIEGRNVNCTPVGGIEDGREIFGYFHAPIGPDASERAAEGRACP